MNKRIWRLAAASVVALAALPVQHALAGGSTTTESGCFDITGDSTGKYENVIKSASTSAGATPLDPWQVNATYYPRAGAAHADVVLSAPSCPSATYNLVVYPDGAHLDMRNARPIRVISQPGDGSTGTLSAPLYVLGLFDHTDATCEETVLQVSDGKTVVDTAPDTGTVRQCKDVPPAQGYGG
jgi:hypothetical protein